MWNSYDLPTTAEIDGKEYKIRSDYREILDILFALDDVDLLDEEKIYSAFQIFYPDYADIKNMEKAIELMFLFINGNNKEDKNKQTKKPLMNWKQDLSIIIPPVNKILQKEIRTESYLHWWTFIAAFMEIGECTFSTYVNIRNKRNNGKKLEKYEQEIYRDNKSAIDLKNKVDSTTQSIMDEIMGVLHG